MPRPTPRGRGHALLERLHVLLVVGHRLGRRRRSSNVDPLLLGEAHALLVGVDQLAEAVGDLHSAGERLEALSSPSLGSAGRSRASGRELRRVVDDERGLIRLGSTYLESRSSAILKPGEARGLQLEARLAGSRAASASAVGYAGEVDG